MYHTYFLAREEANSEARHGITFFETRVFDNVLLSTSKIENVLNGKFSIPLKREQLPC